MEEELPHATELEPALTNGVMLAKLAHFFEPELVSLKKIYDIDLSHFQVRTVEHHRREREKGG